MTKYKHIRWLAGMAALVMTAWSPPDLEGQETSISGLFFGDYYGALSHHDSEVDGANGFWIRRMYLTVNTRFTSEWDARVRLEAASSGDFETSGTANPFIKDLYVRWRRGNHQVLIGLSSSPTWNFIEGQWGYRDVEKTPLDLLKMGSSRDLGVSFKGSIDEDQKFRYHLMFGNGSATKAETNKGKKVMGALQFYPTSNLIFEANADYESRGEGMDRTTYQAAGVARGESGRVGVMAARQVRGETGEDDVNVDVYSVFGVLDAGDRVNLMARWDRMATPIPDGAKISYFRMDPTSAGHFFLAGVDIMLDEHFHLIPNVEAVSYDEDELDADVFLKLTFSVSF
jgi:hypothetical protein